MQLQTTRRYFRVDRGRIAYIRFILEGYDGIGMISTIDPHRGIICVRIAPGCEADVGALFVSFSENTCLLPLSETEAVGETVCQGG